MECLSYCISHSIDLALLDNFFKTQSTQYISTRSRDVVKLESPTCKTELIFVFKNGTLVTWGIKRHKLADIIFTIKKFTSKPILALVHDEFSYQLTGKKISIEPHEYFDVDCLKIDPVLDCEELRLSLSYGFSQSVKLQAFENRIDTLAEKHTPLINAISAAGKIPLSRKEIRKVVGEIIETKADLNLISNFLYHPKYFWQHPTLEEYFIMLERYLHIQRRLSAINHRLDTIDEIFHMFNQYLEYRHAHHLEIIIIFLIAIEIIFGVLGFHY